MAPSSLMRGTAIIRLFTADLSYSTESSVDIFIGIKTAQAEANGSPGSRPYVNVHQWGTVKAGPHRNLIVAAYRHL